ncbi:claudin-15 isoform X3 [Physeter macrocephalus]|uniref:Claudin-15 isoform X3 n=1 Tax=Physeter macrocephalus TaxID=9755 RepID=A0A455AUJ0_PHYMC|nr:claudin-15 isoform X3 [Physeter catodon]|eukprot:XP_028339819.1 claudin-15 isoform X1 [Physeter catodon]
MSVAVEIFGFFIAALGLLMLGLTLTHSNWRVSSMDGNIITTSAIFENLWYSCATDSLGVYNCWEFPSMLSLSGESFSRPLPRPRGDDKKPYAAQLPRPHWALPCPPYTAPWCKEGPQLGLLLETSRDIQACRALMITAILLGSLGLFLGMVGLRCTNIGGLEPSRKTKLAATAGALHLLAGVCGIVAISWYAFSITRDFFDPLYTGTKYELGPALYLGWSASLLAILGGTCLFSNCCRSRDEDHGASIRLPYKAPAMPAKSLAARLPTSASDEEGDSSFGKYGKNAYV